MSTGCLFNALPVAASTGIRPSTLPSKTEAQQPPQTLPEAENTKIPKFRKECLLVVYAKVVIFCSKRDEREQESCPSRPFARVSNPTASMA
jgi:hypothetical protein